MPTPLKAVACGTWNVEVGHKPVADHVQMILTEFDAQGLDVLFLQEMAGYAGELEKEAAVKGYVFITFHSSQGQNQQGILVRDPKKVSRARVFKSGNWLKPFFTKTGAHVPGLMPVAINYDTALALACYHSPVSVHWRKGVPVGPVRRVAAYIGHSHRLVRFLKTNRRAVAAGDNNATPKDQGYASPQWIAKKSGGHVVSPGANTGHGMIDFPIVKGVWVSGVEVHKPDPAKAPVSGWPDHYLVTFTVHYKKVGTVVTPPPPTPPTKPPTVKKIAAPAPPYVGPAAHTSAGSNQPIRRVVIHCTVSPCVAGGARATAAFFRDPKSGGSAHYVVDPGEAVQVVYDDTIAWHAPPNQNSIGIELTDPMVDKAGHELPAARWDDADHQAMLHRAAQLTAQLCAAYGVPVARLSSADLLAGKRGICGHADVSQAWHQSDHWDPGHNFPWPAFMAMVHAEYAQLFK